MNVKKITIIFLMLVITFPCSVFSMDDDLFPLEGGRSHAGSKVSGLALSSRPLQKIERHGPIDTEMIKMRIAMIGVDGIRKEIKEREERRASRMEMQGENGRACRMPLLLKIDVVFSPSEATSLLERMILNEIAEIEHKNSNQKEGKLDKCTRYLKQIINEQPTIIARSRFYHHEPIEEELVKALLS
jgi:hypothetical protein